MRQRRTIEPFEQFLWGEVLLFCLLGTALVLFLSDPALRAQYQLPELRLVLATVFALAAGLVSLLTATRFRVEGRRFDLALCAGFLALSASWVAFSIVPAVAGVEDRKAETWAGLVGGLLGWALIAAAPFLRGPAIRGREALWYTVAAVIEALTVMWIVTTSVGSGLPALAGVARGEAPPGLVVVLAVVTLLNLLAVVGFANRYRIRRDDLDRWLALGATLTLFSSLLYIFTPLSGTADVSKADFLRLLAFGVLLVGVWRAMQESEFRRAVAEERARVARDIHDGLAQYLFAVATHASLLADGADPDTTLPRLKEAALAAQSEARFAILALSSAAGSAPFDTALRRYVDVVTADGELEVELEVEPGFRLAPDEQIEVFRIVQEGLANARKHAGAKRAWVTIAQRGDRRAVTVRDDGHGFESDPADASPVPMGQGIENMRERSQAIGGTFSLQTTPGRGTALEVVLRA